MKNDLVEVNAASTALITTTMRCHGVKHAVASNIVPSFKGEREHFPTARLYVNVKDDSYENGRPAATGTDSTLHSFISDFYGLLHTRYVYVHL